MKAFTRPDGLRFALVGPSCPWLATFGPGLPHLAQVFPVWHCVALFCTVWPCLDPFGSVSPRLNPFSKKRIFFIGIVPHMATLGAIISVNLCSWLYKISQYHIKITKHGQGMWSFATNMNKFVLVSSDASPNHFFFGAWIVFFSYWHSIIGNYCQWVLHVKDELPTKALLKMTPGKQHYPMLIIASASADASGDEAAAK